MKDLSWAAFLLLVCTSGNPSRTPEQGFLWHPGGGAQCPNFSLSRFLFMVCLCLAVSASMYSYALTPRPPCRPWARMLTDAGWGCGAQLGLIAAVYLIKTWEDPTGVSTREDTASIYRFEHGYTHMHTPPHPWGASKEPGACLCLESPGSSSCLNSSVGVCLPVTQCLSEFVPA